MKKMIALFVPLCVLLAAGAGECPAAEDTALSKNVIVVSGTGEAAFPPDTAYIQAGMTSIAKKASECYEKNTAVMNKVLAAIQKHGVKKEDIQTVQFSLSPYYEFIKGENKFAGYQLRHVFSVKVRAIEGLGVLIDEVVDAGANDVSDIRFANSEVKKYAVQAREKAVGDAQAKARTLASSAGVTLGNVLRIEEGAAQGEMPQMRMGAMHMKAADAAPVMSGELKVAVPVTLYYEISGQK